MLSTKKSGIVQQITIFAVNVELVHISRLAIFTATAYAAV